MAGTAEITGFYAVSKTYSNAITFFVQSTMPTGIQPGWVITNVNGIQGHTQVISTTLAKGTDPDNGSFNGLIDFQVDFPQTIQGATRSEAARVSPALSLAPPPPPPLSGAYFTQMGKVIFYSNVSLPSDVSAGWLIRGLPGIVPDLNIVSVFNQPGNLGYISYKVILVTVPAPVVVPDPLDPVAFSKLQSVISQAPQLMDIISGKFWGMNQDIFTNPPKLSNYIASAPNLLNFFSQKTALSTDSILADPTQLKSTLAGLPEIYNALSYRLTKGPSTLLDGFLNDVNMQAALGNGMTVQPALPLTDDVPNGRPVNNQGNLINPAINVFTPAPINTTPNYVPIPIQDGNFKRFPADVRELNHDVPIPPAGPEPLIEKRNLGFNAGGVLSLDAIGPQEEYISNVSEFTQGQWSPVYKQYTNSVIYQDYIQMKPSSSNTFIQPTLPGTCIVELQPKNQGDMLANMFIQCTLPALPSGNSYTNQVGRALFQQIDFLIDGVVVETIYDDWLFIRDNIFLDYDEQLGMPSQVNGGQTAPLSPTIPLNLVIPLEFFFCRRHSHANKGRERLRRPFFPMCALWGGSKVYIKFTFRPQYWFTNYTGQIDILNPVLLIEYVKLTNSERLYYRNTPLRYIVPIVKKNPALAYSAGVARTSISAAFPVQFIAWFIRKVSYESPNPGNYNSRYSYGYGTPYQTIATPLTFAEGTTQYIDVIQSIKITVNNQDILDVFANGPYCSFLQPMQHGLSVPFKNIYTYSFALNVTEYNSGGYLNFAKVDSSTSNLTIVFLPQYAGSLAGYNLYLFYYGFSILTFTQGFAGVSYL